MVCCLYASPLLDLLKHFRADTGKKLSLLFETGFTGGTYYMSITLENHQKLP